VCGVPSSDTFFHTSLLVAFVHKSEHVAMASFWTVQLNLSQRNLINLPEFCNHLAFQQLSAKNVSALQTSPYFSAKVLPFSFVGASHSLTNGPVSGPHANIPQLANGPVLGPQTNAPQVSLAKHRPAYSGQSQVSLLWPITGQFISTNHRQYTDPTDHIKGDYIGQKSQVCSSTCFTPWTVYHQVTETKTILVGVR